MGATYITKPMILNRTSATIWMPSTMGLPFGPSASRPNANITEKNSTGHHVAFGERADRAPGNEAEQELAEAHRMGWPPRRLPHRR